MKINTLFSLKEYNTFDIDVKSVYSFFCYSEESLADLIGSDIYRSNNVLVLGGGSNVLFTEDYNGLVIFMRNKGIELINEDEEFVYIKVSAGEVWDDFVAYSTDNGYGGIENLSLIPGTVGAAPVQNIGAYGVELKDVFHEAEAISRMNGAKVYFNNDDCKFGYRESIFKNEKKDQFIIINVTFKLHKKHILNLDYGTIKEEILDIERPTIQDVRDAVIRIRESKLPDPKNFPNAGSFFKNPVISLIKFEELKKIHPDLVGYPLGGGLVKLAAGQLIDLCNWKGKREKGVGVFEKQALVLVNYHSAGGKDIYSFSEMIKQSVFNKFGVNIEREVTVIQ